MDFYLKMSAMMKVFAGHDIFVQKARVGFKWEPYNSVDT